VNLQLIRSRVFLLDDLNEPAPRVSDDAAISSWVIHHHRYDGRVVLHGRMHLQQLTEGLGDQQRPVARDDYEGIWMHRKRLSGSQHRVASASLLGLVDKNQFG